MSRRGFQALMMITAAVVIAALWAVLSDQQAVISRTEPRPAFAGLAALSGAVENITLTGNGPAVRLRRAGQSPWRVRSSDDYPANQAAVDRLISAMEGLVLVEPRTRRRARLGLLKLGDPAAGEGALGIELMDREEALLAGVVLGSSMRPPSPDQPGRFHVRLTGEDQAWLAEGRLLAPPGTRFWIDQNIGLPADTDIRSIMVTPFEGPDYLMDRAAADVSFVFRSLPEGRRLITPSMPMQLAQSLAFLTVEDARARPATLPRAAAITVFGTFDGRALTISQWVSEAQPWMAIDLSGAWDEPLKSRSAGYVFRLSKARARGLAAPLEALLIPPG